METVMARAAFVSLLGLVARSAAVAVSAGAILFPPAPALVFESGAEVNVTFAAPGTDAPLSTWCDQASPRRENTRIVDTRDGWTPVRLPLVEVETKCWFSFDDAREDDRPRDGSVFTVVPSSSSPPPNQQPELRVRKESTPTRIAARAPAPVEIPSPTAQATTGPGNVPIQCPADHRTVFTDPDTLKRYVVLCGIDYHRDEGAKDIYSRDTSSLNECITMCAITKSCIAVGWGDFNGFLRCWLKSQLGQPHDSASWYVAIEDPSQPGTPPKSATTSSATGAPTGASSGSALPAAAAGGGELSGDAKAGIGVGVTVGAVLAGVAGVLVWYRRQKKKLDRKKQEMLDRKLEVASSCGDGGSASSQANFPLHAQPQPISWPRPPLQPPHRHGVSPTSEGYGAGPTLGMGSCSSFHSDGAVPGSGGFESANAAASVGLTSMGTGGGSVGDASPDLPHLAHVASYLQQRQQKQRGSVAHDLEHAAKAATALSAASLPAVMHSASVSGRSASHLSTMTPSSGSIVIVPPWGNAFIATELPVREGYQGYGPEYEMAAASTPGPPRPWYRAAAAPMPGVAEVDEQKFLLADMATAKVRVLRPDDRHELG